MNAVSALVRTPPPRTARSVPSLTRLLRLELLRSPWPWMIPLLIVLFYFDTFRAAAGYLPMWTLRASVVLNHLAPDLVPFAAGISAWAGSRDGRRSMTDLLAATSRAGWSRRGAALVASLCWMLGLYLVFVAVLYGITAQQATWGGPPLWPVAVGAAELAAASVIGFAAGVFAPTRYTAPLVAVGSYLLVIVAYRKALNATGGYALLSPTTSVPNIDAGVFYRIPDLSIAQVMLLAGVAIAGVGILGLPPAAGGRTLRGAAAVITMAGVAAAAFGFGLTGSAHLDAYGVVVPGLHDAASDRPVPYTPVCAQAAGFPVCVHPAFRKYLQDVTAALTPVFGEVANLAGAPVGVQQVPITDLVTNRPAGGVGAIGGNPPVFYLPMPDPSSRVFSDNVRTDLVTTYIAGSGDYVSLVGTPAQQAVEMGLLMAAGVQEPPRGTRQPPPEAISTAASRFAALSLAARHAWLAAHVSALRAGHLPLAQVP
jgi:hypothetical protein